MAAQKRVNRSDLDFGYSGRATVENQTVTDPFLTLEPLIDAIGEVATASGWDLSGLQKTTSHQFEGRWEGESTRSAYLFFHPLDGSDMASLDVYLDETSRGMSGNVALVVGLRPLGRLYDAERILTVLGRLSARELARGQRRPLSLRFRLSDAEVPAPEAESEVRFKVRIPNPVVRGGRAKLSPWLDSVLEGFSEILRSPELALLSDTEEAPTD